MFGEPTLREGNQGNDVRLLQASLKEHFQLFGAPLVDPGSVDGDFGPGTRRSVEAFQGQLWAVPVDGIVGPLTWSHLDGWDYRFPWSDDLRQGDEGNRVRRLQRLLYAASENPGKVDGLYEGKTTAAVRQFQGAQSLHQDGQASGDTRRRLQGVHG